MLDSIYVQKRIVLNLQRFIVVRLPYNEISVYGHYGMVRDGKLIIINV